MMIYTENSKLVGEPPMTKCSQDCAPHMDMFSMTLAVQEVMCLGNLFLHFFTIFHLICAKSCLFKEISKFLIFYALTIIIRSATILSSTIYLSLVPMEFWEFVKISQCVLYIDYICYYLAGMMIFLISLNRILFFVHRAIFTKLFEKGIRKVSWSVAFLLLSVIASILAISPSEVKRVYLGNIGFVAVGEHGGMHTLINRLFNIFPAASIVFYIIISLHMKKNTNLTVTAASRNLDTGKDKVFEQILTTAVVYGVVSILVEFIYFFDLYMRTNTYQLLVINILNILNFVPEMAFPVLLIWKICTRCVAKKVQVAPMTVVQ